MDNLTLDTWLVSDTHFGHKNIVKYCNRPMNHNELMVKNWDALIQPEDTVLHLGDLAVWYGREEDHWLDVARQLPGQKYMLRGNHDKLKDKVYAGLGYTVIPEFIQTFDLPGRDMVRVLFSHYPDHSRIGQWDINVHGHVHNNGIDPVLAASGRDYRNISVELMDYRPVRLRDILDKPV